jgi:nitrate/nitrite transport system ATP-binding protein
VGPDAFIEIQDVSRTFVSTRTTRPVLAHVRLAVEKGEFVAIVGGMGSGKSTLLSLAAGLDTPDSGRVVIDGEPVNASAGIRPDVSIVFQNYSLLPWFSALENVRLAVASAFPRWSEDDKRAQAKRYLETVGLGGALRKRPGQLSGGMRQRVAIARAFATKPRILFLDDPFGALDALTRATLQNELARLSTTAGAEVTTIMITNNLDEAILLADRIAPMTSGPRATLGETIPVDLPRPRSLDQIMHDENAYRVRARIVERLTETLRGTGRGGVVSGGMVHERVAAGGVA